MKLSNLNEWLTLLAIIASTAKKVLPLFSFVCSALIFSYASAQEVELADVNALFDFAEQEYPAYFAPTAIETDDSITGWFYRYYPGTNSYIAVSLEDGEDFVRGGVYVLGGLFGSEVVYIDLLNNLLALVYSANNAMLVGSISPFELIEIKGSFDPQNSAISILLTDQATGVMVAVPVLSATATAVEFLMPPLVDHVSGELVQGRVDVEILQAGVSTVSRTEILGSPLILEPSLVDDAIFLGDWTIAYFLLGIESLTVASELSAALDLGTDATEALAVITDEMESLLDKVQTLVASGTPQSLTTSDGSIIQMDSDDLDTLDRLIAAYFTSFSAGANDSLTRQSVLAFTRPSSSVNPANMSRESAVSCGGGYEDDGLHLVLDVICPSRENSLESLEPAGRAISRWGSYLNGLPLAASAAAASALAGGGVAASMLITAAFTWITDNLTFTDTTIRSTLEAMLVGGAGSIPGIEPLGLIVPAMRTYFSSTSEIHSSDPVDHAPEKGVVQVNRELTESVGQTVVTRTPADGSDSIHLILPPSATSASVSSLEVVSDPSCDEDCMDLGDDMAEPDLSATLTWIIDANGIATNSPISFSNQSILLPASGGVDSSLSFSNTTITITTTSTTFSISVVFTSQFSSGGGWDCNGRMSGTVPIQKDSPGASWTASILLTGTSSCDPFGDPVSYVTYTDEILFNAVASAPPDIVVE